MRIRSISQLNEFVDNELSWRKRELTTLRFMIGKARRDHEKRLLLRAGICILYAHWEGFIKSVARSYVSFVAMRGLRYCDLAPNFIALGLRSDILTAGQSRRATVHTELTTKFLSGLSERASIDWEHAVDTQSNVNSKVLQDILRTLGLDDKDYLTKGHLIDERLLGNRNMVAHGGRLDIEQDDYDTVHDEIIQLVEWFRTDVENAAIQGSYRSAI